MIEIEQKFITNLFNNPEIIEKTELTGEEFQSIPIRVVFKILKKEYNKKKTTIVVNREILNIIFKGYEENFKKINIDTIDDFKKAIFIDSDEEVDWLYLELILKDNYKKRQYIEALDKTIKEIKEDNVDTALSNLELKISNLQQEDLQEDKIHNLKSFINLYNQRTKEIEELKKQGKLPYYSLYHPVLRDNVRMKLGWLWNLIAKSGSGKTIIAVDFLLNFVKEYRERALFITDENSDEVIMTYLHCNYFNVRYKDVEDRKVDLSELINSLSDEKRKEYEEIFGLIDVVQLSAIPLPKVRKILKNAKLAGSPYTYVFIDSMDEVNAGLPVDEVTRYDANAKELERLAKDMNCILGVANQLATAHYEQSIETITQLCTHQSKTIVKKASLSLLIGEERKKNEDGDTVKIGDRIKINKCRSGGQDLIYEINKDFDYCKIHPGSVSIGTTNAVVF